MVLGEVLNKMNLNAVLYGDVSFDTLALVGTAVDGRILTFIDNPKYVSDTDKDSVVITTPQIASLYSGDSMCVCPEPRLLFFKIHNYLSGDDKYRRKSVRTEIGENCKISNFACISENNVLIGHNTIIEEFVSIKANTVIGNNSIIRAGSIIGGQGFEYKHNGDEILSVAHLGGVGIGNDVEIQQLCAIDRAIFPWDNTVIDDYSKTDNHVHIAHAVKIKKRTLITAGALISGRTNLGNDVWIGPGATVINGITVGDNARISIGAVATRSVSNNKTVTGNFAIDHEKFIRNLKEQNKD